MINGCNSLGYRRWNCPVWGLKNSELMKTQLWFHIASDHLQVMKYHAITLCSLAIGVGKVDGWIVWDPDFAEVQEGEGVKDTGSKEAMRMHCRF